MVFADDERESNPTSFKFLQMAHAWAAAKKTGGPSTLSGFTAPVATADDHADAPSRKGGDDASDVASSHGGDESD